ncbi:MAG TPA: ABC transporter permease [Candidatus Binatia bacterium]|nr:ABC transporter permease [Candidatus Binatia bacterium]
MNAILQPIGRTFLNGLAAIGRLALFSLVAVRHCVTPPFYPRLMLRQMIEIGYYSLPYVGMTAVFTGMVLVLQTYTGFKVGAESAMPTILLISLTRELGPVLGALIVAGRVGAAMAAEIGTMRVTEQIDALSTLSTNPYKYLIAPRLWAGVTMLPMLVAVADVIGILGGYFVSVHKLGFNEGNFLNNVAQDATFKDVFSGLVKAAVFGYTISMMGCYHGFNSKGGAQGVGKATTNAVAASMILILTLDYILTELFFAR